MKTTILTTIAALLIGLSTQAQILSSMSDGAVRQYYDNFQSVKSYNYYNEDIIDNAYVSLSFDGRSVIINGKSYRKNNIYYTPKHNYEIFGFNNPNADDMNTEENYLIRFVKEGSQLRIEISKWRDKSLQRDSDIEKEIYIFKNRSDVFDRLAQKAKSI